MTKSFQWSTSLFLNMLMEVDVTVRLAICSIHQSSDDWRNSGVFFRLFSQVAACMLKVQRTGSCLDFPCQSISWIPLSDHLKVFFSVANNQFNPRISSLSSQVMSFNPWTIFAAHRWIFSRNLMWCHFGDMETKIDTQFHMRPEVRLVKYLELVSCKQTKMPIDTAENRSCLRRYFNTLLARFQIIGYTTLRSPLPWFLLTLSLSLEHSFCTLYRKSDRCALPCTFLGWNPTSTTVFHISPPTRSTLKIIDSSLRQASSSLQSTSWLFLSATTSFVYSWFITRPRNRSSWAKRLIHGNWWPTWSTSSTCLFNFLYPTQSHYPDGVVVLIQFYERFNSFSVCVYFIFYGGV